MPSDWQDISTAPDDGRPVWVKGGRYPEPQIVDADGDWWRAMKDKMPNTIPNRWAPCDPPTEQTDHD